MEPRRLGSLFCPERLADQVSALCAEFFPARQGSLAEVGSAGPFLGGGGLLRHAEWQKRGERAGAAAAAES